MAASKGRRVVKKPASASVAEEPSEGNAYIPELEVYSTYVGRSISGVPDMTMLEHALSNDMNVLLAGPTGSGKTRVGAAFAAMKGIPYYSVPCDVSIDPSALFGKMVPTETVGVFKWQDGPVTELVRTGGVLNLSEINFMSPKISASLFPLLDHRRQLPLLANHGEIIRPAPGELLIIADHNPGYRGTQQLNAAFMNRFPIKSTWDYDDRVEESLVGSASLRAIAKKLRAMAGREIHTPVSTNGLMEFESLAVAFGVQFAIGNFVNAFQPPEQEAVRNALVISESELEKEITAPVPQSASGPAECDDCGLAIGENGDCECDDYVVMFDEDEEVGI